MAKINGLEDEEMEELDAIEEDWDNLCSRCQYYDICYTDGGELPNYIRCFLGDDEDEFFESDDTRKTHIWKEMSYNKYIEH